ncbi:flagellar FliJ family protein [bacterium]|nr:flagellar FliJ family protein [bacterium]
MKKHQFRLESYLKIKQFEEKNSWNEVLQQSARVNYLENQIDDLFKQQSLARKKASLVGFKKESAVHEFMLVDESIAGTQARIEELQKSLFKEKKTLEILKNKHIESKKELKTIEKLKENDIVKFKIKKEKIEAKRNDEIAQQMFHRGRVENE